MDMSTLLYLKQVTNKDLLHSMGSSAQHEVAGWMTGELSGEWIHAYIRLSPFTVHPKLPRHCSLAILQNKIKNLFFKNDVYLIFK